MVELGDYKFLQEEEFLKGFERSPSDQYIDARILPCTNVCSNTKETVKLD